MLSLLPQVQSPSSWIPHCNAHCYLLCCCDALRHPLAIVIAVAILMFRSIPISGASCCGHCSLLLVIRAKGLSTPFSQGLRHSVFTHARISHPMIEQICFQGLRPKHERLWLGGKIPLSGGWCMEGVRNGISMGEWDPALNSVVLDRPLMTARATARP